MNREHAKFENSQENSDTDHGGFASYHGLGMVDLLCQMMLLLRLVSRALPWIFWDLCFGLIVLQDLFLTWQSGAVNDCGS